MGYITDASLKHVLLGCVLLIIYFNTIHAQNNLMISGIFKTNIPSSKVVLKCVLQKKHGSLANILLGN